MSFETTLDLVRHEYLQRMTHGNGRLLRQVEDYAAHRSGKLLRPRMLLACAATLPPTDNRQASRRTLLLATAMEMLHNASLLHDDVVDHATQRRGQLSVNQRWNSTIAVLVGDYHLAQIMLLLDETDDIEATRRVNRTVLQMVEGELLQQEVLSRGHATEEEYLQIIDGKTAALFATAAALGNPAMEGFGLCYGRLFQMADDLADGEAPPFVAAIQARERQRLADLAQAGLTPPAELFSTSDLQ